MESRPFLGQLRGGVCQSILLESSQAFGPRDEGKVQQMPKSDFPEEMELEPGLVVGFDAPNGTEVAGIILEADTEVVKVDFNHPLAGKDVLFKVEVLKVIQPADSDTPPQ